MKNTDDFELAYEEALSAAKAAANAHDAKLGAETARGFDCGFAWVELRPATHPFVRWLKAIPHGREHGSKGWNGGWHIWNPSQHPTQSIGTKEAGARAFRDVLVHHACIAGLTVSVGSSLD
jgi:hypothetical protein